jgi:Trk K+ transport system NAD-binding subunit
VEGDISERSRFAGRKLRELGDLSDGFLLLLAKNAGEDTEIPNGDTTLDAGAHVVLIVKSGDTKLLAQICGN